MNSKYIKYVKELTEEEFVALYGACKVRLANNIRKIVVFDKVIDTWKRDRLVALLTMRELYPEYGLNELKISIMNRLEELGLLNVKTDH